MTFICLISSCFKVVETTNSVFNLELFKYVTPQVRVSVTA